MAENDQIYFQIVATDERQFQRHYQSANMNNSLSNLILKASAKQEILDSDSLQYEYLGCYRLREGQPQKEVLFSIWGSQSAPNIARVVRDSSMYACKTDELKGMAFFKNIFGRTYPSKEKLLQGAQNQKIWQEEGNILDETYQPAFSEEKKKLIARIMSRIEKKADTENNIIIKNQESTSEASLSLLEDIYLLLPETLRNQTPFYTKQPAKPNMGINIVCTNKEVHQVPNQQVFDVESEEIYSYDEAVVNRYLQLMEIPPELLQFFLALEEKIDQTIGRAPSFKNQSQITKRVLQDYEKYRKTNKAPDFKERIKEIILAEYENYMKSKAQGTLNADEFINIKLLQEIEHEGVKKNIAYKLLQDEKYEIKGKWLTLKGSDYLSLPSLRREIEKSYEIKIPNQVYQIEEYLHQLERDYETKENTLQSLNGMEPRGNEFLKRSQDLDEELTELVKTYQSLGKLQFKKRQMVKEKIKQRIEECLNEIQEQLEKIKQIIQVEIPNYHTAKEMKEEIEQFCNIETFIAVARKKILFPKEYDIEAYLSSFLSEIIEQLQDIKKRYFPQDLESMKHKMEEGIYELPGKVL